VIGLALIAARLDRNLLAITLAGLDAAVSGRPRLLMAVGRFAFGMTMPNVMNATMRPLPDIAGTVGSARREHSK